MFVPSNAIAFGSLPTAKVPRVVPVGDSLVTLLLTELTTHIFVPSNAIPCGLTPTSKVPTGPHVGVPHEMLWQSPIPSGARHSFAPWEQVLQGPVAQSLSCAHAAQPVPAPQCGVSPPHAVQAAPPVPQESLPCPEYGSHVPVGPPLQQPFG